MTAAATMPLWLPFAPGLSRPAIIRPAEHALLKPGAFRPMTRKECQATIADLVRGSRLTFAEAQRAMFFVPVMGVARKAAPSFTYNNRYADSSDTATYTFSSSSIGAAAANRLVVVGVASGDASGSASSHMTVTVGGNAATLIAQAGGTVFASLWYINVPSGTTATVVVSCTSGGYFECGIGIWSLYNLSSFTPVSHAEGSSATSNLNMNVNKNDIIVMMTHNYPGSTSLTGVTSDFSGVTIDGTALMTGGSYQAAAAETPRTLTATFSSATYRGAAAAVWR